jgi:DNA polymerase-4
MGDEVSRYYPANGRVILHLDMNAFYCSVHAAEEPERYAGKPTAVSGSVDERRGIIVTSSYEARSRGVKTGMQVWEALKRCPELILIRPDFALYWEYSRRIMAIAGRFTPLVETVSIDECYLDITGSKRFGTPPAIAEQMQRCIREELNLPCSIGIAPNKLLAKMASDMKKPGGITILRLRDVPGLLWDKPCRALFGVGRKTADKLARLNIHTIGQLAAADESMLIEHFGVTGSALKRAANGCDDSPVDPERARNKSIVHATTLPLDFTDPAAIRKVFLNLADQVARRLRRRRLLANTVQITIRDPAMKTITRAATLTAPTEDTQTIYKEACELFRRNWRAGRPVRLLGISLHNLEDRAETAIQLDLFEFDRTPKLERLNQVMDRLRDKFGENAVVTAGMLGDDASSLLRDHRRRGTSLQTDWLIEADPSDSEGDPKYDEGPSRRK